MRPLVTAVLTAGLVLTAFGPAVGAVAGPPAPLPLGGQVAEGAFLLQPRPTGVERVAGPDRVATAVEISRRGYLRADTVVIAAAGAFPDALAAAPLAASLGGPLLLVGARLAPVLAEELTRLGASEAVVIGAVGAVPLIVSEELKRAGLRVRRIAGESRFDTAALIAREVGSDDGRAVVVNGSTFADALSIAPFAAAEGLPILLTPSGSLVQDTAEVLDELGISETLVIGGTAAVSDAVLAELPGAERLAGDTRYATSLAVADYWADRGMTLETVHVATGRDFPDALAAGPVAALARGPLLLVDGLDQAVPEDTYTWLEARADAIDGAYAFGGSAVVADVVLERLRAAIGASS